jgi:hypothetical protein
VNDWCAFIGYVSAQTSRHAKKKKKKRGKKGAIPDADVPPDRLLRLDTSATEVSVIEATFKLQGQDTSAIAGMRDTLIDQYA